MIINGQHTEQLSAADRAVQFGDGCFTTMAYRQGKIELLERHIARLQLSCQRLSINFCAWDELHSSIALCLKQQPDQTSDGVIKVIISRGQGGRGYSAAGVHTPAFIVSNHPMPAHYSQWQQKGIRLTVSPVKLGVQPLLAGIKHLNRLEQVLIKNTLENSEFNDAIVCNSDDQIIETSGSNLFWSDGACWYTADLSGSGVEGVMRNLILQIMDEQGWQSKIVKHQLSDLLNAEQVFICNSLMKLVPVKHIYDPETGRSYDFNINELAPLQDLINQHIHPSVVAS